MLSGDSGSGNLASTRVAKRHRSEKNQGSRWTCEYIRPGNEDNLVGNFDVVSMYSPPWPEERPMSSHLGQEVACKTVSRSPLAARIDVGRMG